MREDQLFGISWFKVMERNLRRRFPKLDVRVMPDMFDKGRVVATGYRFANEGRVRHEWAKIAVYCAANKNNFLDKASKKLLEQCYPYQKFPVH